MTNETLKAAIRARRSKRAYSAFGTVNKRGERWCSDAAAHFRILGPAHEHADLRHTGWYCDDVAQSELAVGYVLRLPHGRYLAAMADPYNAGQYLIDCSHVFAADELRDCAWAADRIAEAYAERECEHQAQWRVAYDWEQARERLCELRREHTAAIAARAWRTAVHALDEARELIASIRATERDRSPTELRSMLGY